MRKALGLCLKAFLMAAVLLLLAGWTPTNVHADERGLNVLRTPVYGFTAWKVENTKKYAAGAGSTFYITRIQDSKTYVEFEKTTKAPKQGETAYAKAVEKQIYVIEESELPYMYRMRWGIAHGPLIVPFKYKISDGTISGESSIGYYLGVTSETLLLDGTAFVSMGLPVPNTDDGAEANDALTLAVGYGIETQTGFQAAIVVGGDLGSDEGDVWLSFAIGFNFIE